jgi:hypothetical protein
MRCFAVRQKNDANKQKKRREGKTRRFVVSCGYKNKDNEETLFLQKLQ